MLTLKTLKSPKGAHRNIKRLGRGHGSGQGQQAGKGHKGQKARSGGGVRTGFEGGHLPLYMRLPKRGFLNARFKKEFAIVNLEDLENFTASEVTPETLVSCGVVSKEKKKFPFKVLGNGDLSKPLMFRNIAKFSKSAVEKINKAGGKIETSSLKDGE